MLIVQFYDKDHRSMLGSDGCVIAHDLKTVKGIERRASLHLKHTLRETVARIGDYEVFQVSEEDFYKSSAWKLLASGHVSYLLGTLP
jgi:hypothetical protein